MSYTTAPSSTIYPIVSKSPAPWSGAAGQYGMGCPGCFGFGAEEDCSKYLGVDAAAYLKCTQAQQQRSTAFGSVLGVGALLLAIWAYSAVAKPATATQPRRRRRRRVSRSRRKR